uniref:Protein kinase domain-containing protein n=1 Tax=Gongylonema pulchrum TaxID=637853 RepID=A0A183DUI3_9BILA
LFISTEKIMVLNTDLQRISDTDVRQRISDTDVRQDILMDHALRTISYIADIGDLVVLMARRMSQSTNDDETIAERTPRVICHVFESDEASFIAQSIGQAFQVAYVEFLRANGIDDPSYLREIDYQDILMDHALRTISYIADIGDLVVLMARRMSQSTNDDETIAERTPRVICHVFESDEASFIAQSIGQAFQVAYVEFLRANGIDDPSYLREIDYQIIAINGISLVGLPLASAQQNIKAAKTSTAVRLTVVSTPPVVEVRIKRPDTKYQLGFSVQNGVNMWNGTLNYGDVALTLILTSVRLVYAVLALAAVVKLKKEEDSDK